MDENGMAHVNKNIDQNREKISVYRLYFVVNRINAEQHVYFINRIDGGKGEKREKCEFRSKSTPHNSTEPELNKQLK